MTIVPTHHVTEQVRVLLVNAVLLWDSLTPEQREQAQRELRAIMHPEEIEKLRQLTEKLKEK